MPDEPAVLELRLVVTAADYDAALHFYRDVLGWSARPGPGPSTSAPRRHTGVLTAT